LGRAVSAPHTWDEAANMSKQGILVVDDQIEQDAIPCSTSYQLASAGLDFTKRFRCKVCVAMMVAGWVIGITSTMVGFKHLPDKTRRLSVGDGAFKNMPASSNASAALLTSLPVAMNLSRPTHSSWNNKIFQGPYTNPNPVIITRWPVKTVCLCNDSPRRVWLSLQSKKSAGGYFWSTSSRVVGPGQNRCGCADEAALRWWGTDGAVLTCRWVHEWDGPLRTNPCQGNSFQYDRNSNLMGVYVCNGNGPTCTYSGPTQHVV